ncbi:MAG: hypothetical protein H6861_08675 [Rhodospirillales bacterium]|nr:hypothetical protein [Rhodospirillales bacterium]
MDIEINKFNKWVLKHSIWMQVSLPALIGVSGSFLDYSPEHLKNDHPLRYALLNDWILPSLLWVLIVSIVLYIALLIVEQSAKPKIEKLLNELSEANDKSRVISENVSELFDGYLYRLATKLGFGTQTANCERITLYIHDKNGSFIQCGRYSANPQYRGVNRTNYPDTEGCIAKGWENGWHFDASFPCPDTDKAGYIDYCLNEYSVPRNTTRRIKMKSRLYAVSCVKKNEESFAVIVVESLEMDRFSEDILKVALEEQSDYLGHIVCVLRNYIPEPNAAESLGL